MRTSHAWMLAALVGLSSCQSKSSRSNKSGEPAAARDAAPATGAAVGTEFWSGTLWPKVKCPVLALFGGKDFQVPADVNLRALAEVATRDNRDVTTKKLAGLNHLFQLAGTGMLDEYAEIDETFNPDALAVIGEWLAARGFSARP